MTRCDCDHFVMPKYNKYCDDHCRICGHGWAEHISECKADLESEETDFCHLCCTGYDYEAGEPPAF